MRIFTVLVLLAEVVCAVPAVAQGTQRMWYQGPFDGWVDLKSKPAYGYYYHPSAPTAYPLNEAAYGQPIPCEKCGHLHYPGQAVCPFCGAACPAGGNREAKTTVYRPNALPGAYWFEEQPHYRYSAPTRLGWPYQKYIRPYH